MIKNYCIISGLYLFLQVQFPLFLVSIEFKHFIIFGCGNDSNDLISNTSKCFFLTGGPIMNIAIWIWLRIFTYDSMNNEDVIKDCPFFETNGVDFFTCEVPIPFILICNIFFLIWIMVVSIFARYLLLIYVPSFTSIL